MASSRRAFVVAWTIALVFYVVQYASRSAPGLMIPQLEQALSLSASGVSNVVGAYYYTYALVSLVAGIALDRAGAKYAIATGAALFGIGSLLFCVARPDVAYAARMLQGAGSAFAFTGAVYLATQGFSAGVLATVVGITQSAGMLGGSAGQFAIAPLIGNGLDWRVVWLGLGIAGLAIAVGLVAIVPRRESASSAKPGGLLSPYRIVFGNPQSYVCGIVAGLLFAPTTIGMMTWGVAFFQSDRSLPYQEAVLSAAVVPLGWAVGCPLLGWLADRLGRRKPVLAGGAAAMLLAIAQITFFPHLVPAAASLFLAGVASGAAMIPYTMIKEVNPDEVKGSSTGAINFINFGVTSLIGPTFAALFGRTLDHAGDPIRHFQQAGTFWLVVVAAAAFLMFFLRETGRGAKGVPRGSLTPDH